MQIKSTPFFKIFSGSRIPVSAPRGAFPRGGRLTPQNFNPSKHPLWKSFVNPQNYAQEIPRGENHGSRKSRNFVTSCHFFLCKSKMYTQPSPCLWKTLVEKSVENVENCEFSTGISRSYFPGCSCGKLCIFPCILHLIFPQNLCYVSGYSSSRPGGHGRKS